jgi:hypothetical protein
MFASILASGGVARAPSVPLSRLGALHDPLDKSSSDGLLDVVGGEAEIEAFGAVEPRAGQRHELADAAGQRGRYQPPPTSGNSPMPSPAWRARVLGRDREFARQRDADAAAHGDAVHDRDGRLGISEQQVVEAIFG